MDSIKLNLDKTNMKANIESQGRSISLTFMKEIENINQVALKIKKYQKFVFVGCGDKYIIPLISQYFWLKNSDKPLSVFHAKILANYTPKIIDKNTCVIFLTQSGTTVDVLEACDTVMKRNACIVAITNLKEEKENSILWKCKGYKRFYAIRTWTEIYPEEPLPSTATFHTSLAVLNLLVFLLSGSEKEMDMQVNQIPKVVDWLSRNEKLKDYAKSIAKKLKDKENFYIVGDGPRYAVARKAARIMFMEGVKTNACDIEGEEFVHSLIEVVERKPNMLLLLKPLGFWEKAEKNYNLIRSIWPKKLLIDIDPFDFIDAETKSIFAGENGDLFSPFIYIIPLEWISYYLALMKKVDPGMARIVKKVRSEKNLQKLFNLKK
jgi:glucosamine--fructose-6-phosphate aminotransferase (isomerizing)